MSIIELNGPNDKVSKNATGKVMPYKTYFSCNHFF